MCYFRMGEQQTAVSPHHPQTITQLKKLTTVYHTHWGKGGRTAVSPLPSHPPFHHNVPMFGDLLQT
ncbi:MAG: hypothetical protein GY805_18935 [Chloroflexi bacterium]|nr:hypothetical protein [Chloroflexota bacterium]